MVTLLDLEGKATISVEEAAELLGLGRTQAYNAVNRGELPSIKVGRRTLVPVPKLKEMLGVSA